MFTPKDFVHEDSKKKKKGERSVGGAQSTRILHAIGLCKRVSGRGRGVKSVNLQLLEHRGAIVINRGKARDSYSEAAEPHLVKVITTLSFAELGLSFYGGLVLELSASSFEEALLHRFH